MSQLTPEQKKLLESLEEEFKDRYTEDDEDYRRVLDKDELIPPIIERWGGGGDRNNDRYGRNDRNRHYRRDRGNDRRRDYYNNDERRYNTYQRGYHNSSYETNNYPNYRQRPY